MLTLLLTLALSPTNLTDVDAAPDTPSARLLQGEILELSRGDLPGAMLIYRRLLEDADTPADVQAQSLLALARCHRKRGELSEARALLATLVDKHSGQEEVVKSARSFLRELERGRADNAKFDWMGELAKNPEIQVRVFDLILGLVDSDENANQLKALGGMALPLLREMVGQTKSAVHRVRLARVMVEMGEFDAIRFAHPGGLMVTWDNWLVGFVRSRGATEQARFAAVVSELTAKNPAFAYLWLGTADFRELDDATARRVREEIDRVLEGFLDRDLISVVRNVAVSVPASRIVLQALAKPRAAERGSAPPRAEARASLVLRLLQQHPNAVNDEVVKLSKSLVDTRIPGVNLVALVRRLVELERWTDVEQLIEDHPDQIRSALRHTELSDLSAKSRAHAFELMGDWTSLQELAEGDAEFVPAFARFLARREQIAPDFRGRQDIAAGVNSRRSKRSVRSTRGTRRRSRVRSHFPVGDHITDAYARLMLQLLERNEDPTACRIAVEALTRYHGDLDLTPVLSRVASESDDFLTAGWAVAALIVRSADHPETRTATLDQVVALADRVTPEAIARWKPGSHQPNRIDFLQYVTNAVSDEEWDTLAESWVKDFREVPLQLISSQSNVFWPSVRAHLLTLDTVADKTIALRFVFQGGGGRLLRDEGDGVLPKIHEWTLDRSLPLAARLGVCHELLRYDAFPWADFFSSDDPMLPALLESGPSKLQNRLNQLDASAFLASPVPSVKAWALRGCPLENPALIPALEKGMASADSTVRMAALGRIASVNRPENVPLLVKLATDPSVSTQLRWQALDVLKKLQAFETIEALTPLLDDPDHHVRNNALATLESLREVQAKREAWKRKSQ